eukprot:scaffold18012_cov53-Cyclotella_meneghiniana.AAC.4
MQRTVPQSTLATHRGSKSHHVGLLQASVVEKDGLFWPAASDKTQSDENRDNHQDEDDKLMGQVLDSVLKVYATHSEPDYLIPWQKRHQTTSTSSGFVIDVPGLGLRVMTNAHSVEYGSVVQVQRRGEDEKHEAVIEAVGNECDLALLRVDSLFPPPKNVNGENDDEDDTTIALQLGPLPSLQDEVEVLGYPSGGESLCVTKGVVSRIETQEYAQAGARLLAMQIDAAINPGNSGGPVVNEYMQVVGVAFQGLDEAENCGYVVPVSVVRHFLEDVRRNNGYTGFCQLGTSIIFLENEAFRKYLKLDNQESVNGTNGSRLRKRRSGVMVRAIEPASGAFGKLRPNDVIMAVDGITLGSDGKVPFRRGERVDLLCYISSLFEGDTLEITILRDGEEMVVSVPLSRIPSLVPSHYNNKSPPYLICSGLVFTSLSVPYLEAKGAWEEYYSDSVLAHKANLGYEHLMDLHLIEFNGIEVRCLSHLKQLIDESDDPFMTFQFAPKETGRLVVLDRVQTGIATKDVCIEHRIGTPYLFYDKS